MADDAIAYLNQLNELAPEKPFFVYYVPGGTHAPHHPTPEWIKKISDRFESVCRCLLADTSGGSHGRITRRGEEHDSAPK
jgi:arylsulfatase A-like enzyme